MDKKNPDKNAGELLQYEISYRMRQQNSRSYLRPSIVAASGECSLYGAAGAGTLSWMQSFVCQTTPHFDSTLRKDPYSVLLYHTPVFVKSKGKLFHHEKKFVKMAEQRLTLDRHII